MRMHVADEILREVEERKIDDIFSEPGKTKVLLQLKELEMIEVSEDGVEITEEGKMAMELGIKNYFAHKKALRQTEASPETHSSPETEVCPDLTISYAIPALIIVFLLLLLYFGAIQLG